MFWTFVMEVPTGVIADYFGRKYSVGLGVILIAITSLIYGSIPKFEVFLLGLLPLAIFLFSPLKQETLEEKIIEIKN